MRQIAKRVLIFVLVASLVFSVFTIFAADITNAADLGDLSHYNGLLFDYFESVQADIEGALAVGGPSRIGTSGQFDFGASAHYVVMGNYNNPSGYPTLLMGDVPRSVSKPGSTGTVNVYGGPIVIPEGKRGSYPGGMSGTLRTAEDQLVADFFYNAYNTVSHTLNVLENANTQPAGTIALSSFNGWSTNYRNVFSNLNNFVPDNMTTPAGVNALVINVTTSNGYADLFATHITSAMGAYDMIIFNFPDVDSVRFSGSSLLVDGSQINTTAKVGMSGNAQLKQYAEKVVWNFPSAQTIQVVNSGVVGSIIAPEALVEGNGGSINGMLIARSFITEGGCELHSFYLNKNIWDFENPTPDLPTGEVVLYKYEEGGTLSSYKLLPGAKFELFQWDEATQSWFSRGTEVMDDSGQIRIRLRYGEYYCEEIEAPAGYELPANVNDRRHFFTIDAHHGTTKPVEIFVPNTPILMDVSLYKVDASDPLESNWTALEGAHCDLYMVTGRMMQYIGSYESGSDGMINFTGLVEGRYRVIEVDTPEGYGRPYDYNYIEFVLQASGEIIFYGVQSDGTLVQVKPDPMDPLAPTNVNDPAFGSLMVRNQQRVDDPDEVRVLITKLDADDEELPLEGVTFELYVSDSNTAAGPWTPVTHDKGGNALNLTTDAFGNIYLYLELGWYRLVEDPASVPDGYAIIGDGETIFQVRDPNSPFGMPLGMPVSGLPAEEEADSDAADNGEDAIAVEPEGSQESGEEEPETEDPASALPEEPPENETAVEDSVLFSDAEEEDGEYREVLEGFLPLQVRAEGTYIAMLEDPGQAVEPPSGEAEPEDDETEDPPDNAEEPAAGEEAPEADAGEEKPVVAPAGGDAPILRGPVGAPLIDLNDDTLHVVIYNKALGKISVTKRSSETGETLAGAEFQLYVDASYDVGGGTIERWDLVASATTSAGGTVVFENLPPGTYRVYEVTAPDGYEEIVIPELVSVKDSFPEVTDVTIGTVSGTQYFEYEFLARNPPATGGITIKKVDGDTGEALVGGSFTLYTFDESVHQWVKVREYSNTNGTISVMPLPYGRYKITEMTPPSGYVVDTAYDQHEILFSVTAFKNNGLVVTVENYEGPPESEDSSRRRRTTSTTDDPVSFDPRDPEVPMLMDREPEFPMPDNSNPLTGVQRTRLIFSSSIALVAACGLWWLSKDED